MKSTNFKICRSTNLFIVIFILVTGTQCNKEKANGDNDSKEIETLSDDFGKDTAMLALAAELLYKNDQYYRASEEYGKLIKIDSLNGKFFFRKGYSLTQIDSPFKALEYYLKAAELKFKEAECYFVIGTIHSIADRDSLAIAYLEKALSLEPDMEKAKKALSNVRQKSKNASL